MVTEGTSGAILNKQICKWPITGLMCIQKEKKKIPFWHFQHGDSVYTVSLKRIPPFCLSRVARKFSCDVVIRVLLKYPISVSMSYKPLFSGCLNARFESHIWEFWVINDPRLSLRLALMVHHYIIHTSHSTWISRKRITN